MSTKPQPKLQIGSPRARRTVLDDATFDELSGRVNEQSLTTPEAEADSRSTTERETLAEPSTVPVASVVRRERKGKKGDPYVRKTDGIPTVPQYLTLPAELVKRLKLYAVQHDKRLSDVASVAISQYLDEQVERRRP
ncbi:MAG: hypothetical protein K8H88_26900 [Sandaracinaceae bacterium]|nr:hypothetical protein [Sandaracinaceae bacterium]